MIKKSLLPIALILMMSLLAGCGGGAGSSSTPAGVNPSVPSIVQLLPVQQIVQTNSSITLKAKVLDGNGATMAGVPVVFTNLSLLGVLSSTTATTDSMGYATVSLFSTDSGFSTIQAEVNIGSGKVRDKKMVFFSIFDLFLPAPPTVLPTLTLAVDSNNDGSYNDPSDFFLTSGEAIVRATVLDDTSSPVLNDTVTFGADSTEVTFPDGQAKTTNSAGEAFARIKVVPSETRNADTPVNVNAVSKTTGAFNVITVFLTPIEVGQISVAADPAIVASGGTSTISATVTTAIGTLVPDGTAVNFTASSGAIAPFGQTAKGVATAKYTAPTLTAGSSDLSVSINASSGGKSASTSITVTAPVVTPTALALNPKLATLPCGGTPLASATFFVSGGTPPYSIVLSVSTDPLTAAPTTVSTSGGSFTVTPTATPPATACDGITSGSSKTFNLLVKDSSPTPQIITLPITLTNP